MLTNREIHEFIDRFHQLPSTDTPKALAEYGRFADTKFDIQHIPGLLAVRAKYAPRVDNIEEDVCCGVDVTVAVTDLHQAMIRDMYGLR